MNTQTFLVPIDFTETTENAIKYALNLSQGAEDEVVLLHIEQEYETLIIDEMLKELIHKYSSDFDGKLSYKVIDGKVASDIGKEAKAMNATLIVMGIYSKNRLQKMLGSKAVKVIAKSEIPFIIVQKGASFKPIEKIAMTIDLEKESVQVVKTAVTLSQFFNAELVLVGGDHKDENFKKKITNHMRIASSHLNENNISCSFQFLERKNFNENLLAYAKENDIDMLAATYYPDTLKILSEKFVQHLLTNKLNIPILTIDAEAISSGTQFSFLSV